MESAVKKAGVPMDERLVYPLVTKSGVNRSGTTVHYYFNYSAQPKTFVYASAAGAELLSNSQVNQNQTLTLEPWGVMIIAAK